MPITLTHSQRAMATGAIAAATLIGAFALGTTAGSAAPSSAGQHPSQIQADAASNQPARSARITVTGTGTVTGTPNQLILSMGVQVNAISVSAALQRADEAVNRVTGSLRANGVAASDIQTADLYIQPNYQDNSSTPNSYGVSESLTATLRRISVAGAQIDAAVHAGGNAVTIDDISLNLTDTSSLLARARAAAVADARNKAAQYAAALGRPLGPVLSITDQAPAEPFPANAAGAAEQKASSVPISPGTQQLSVSITVVYAIG
jgi:uncharacterized protein